MTARTYFPVFGHQFCAAPAANQRVRHAFNDKRLADNFDFLSMRMAQRKTVTVDRLVDDSRQRDAFLRFLHNDKVTLEELIYQLTRMDPSLTTGRDVLLITDACVIDVGLGRKRRNQLLKDVGAIGGKATAGYTLMPCLVVDVNTDQCLGVSEIVQYSRPAPSRNKKTVKRQRRERQKLPVLQKESGAWVTTSRGGATQLGSAIRRTAVMDQGGDVYGVLAHLLTAPEELDVLVRSKYDRQAELDQPGGQTVHERISAIMSRQEWRDQREVQLRSLDHHSKTKPASPRRRRARTAKLNIRSASVVLQRPQGADADLPPTLKVNVVEVVEDAQTVPEGEKPIRWQIITSWPIDTLDQLWAVIDGYCQRWHIEQVFRVLKRDGLNLEASQLRGAQALKKLGVMSVKASVEVMQLVNGRDDVETPSSLLFDEYDQKFLARQNDYYEGNTVKQCNPHPEGTLAYAAWVIGRMGGWKGYASQKPAGPKRMQRGLQEFRTQSALLRRINMIL